MKISLNWLKLYIDFNFSPAQLAEKLTMAGLEVENVDIKSQLAKNIVIGDIIKIEDHPNADNLHICQVNIGKKEISVICGADNTREKQRVPVAVIGSVIADGTEIKRVKLRGMVSEGMICSERELGISNNHDGIMVLPKSDYRVGEEFKANAPVDTVLNIDVSPNRPDCLSHLGVAREVGVIANSKLRKPDSTVKESKSSASNSVKVTIDDKSACPRYSARVIRNVQIKESPQWLKNCLQSVGIRSINNVVDITNFVLMETGHPLHAFDYDLIEGAEIKVRKAYPQEKFITLDNEERILDENDLLVCDGEKGVGLAGIMGGCNSEISAKTKNILLEAAYFDPFTIRRTSKKLGLFTEASQRFERGVDPHNTVYALNRACHLLQELAQGTIEKDVVDAYPQKIEPEIVKLRFSRITHLIGQEIPQAIILEILQGLELTIMEKKSEFLLLKIPTFRPDLKQECDIIEEIVRHYGYNKVKENMFAHISLGYSENSSEEYIEAIKDYLVGQGLIETVSNTLVSEKHVEILDRENVVQVENPLSPETTFLRNSCIPSLLDTIKWNINRSLNNIRIFEIGRIFIDRKNSLPLEKTDIVCALTGMGKKVQLWNKEKDKEVSFYQLKGMVESLLDFFHINNYSFTLKKTPFFTDDCSFAISFDKKIYGYLGKINAEILNSWEIKQPVYIVELDLNSVINYVKKEISYLPVPKFPYIIRDLSVMVEEDVLSGDMTECIVNEGGKYLNQVDIFDVYRGKGIPEGKKSITFNLKFISKEKTLTEIEIDPIFNAIIKSLENKFSAALRS